jgi:diacylglycerol O-acyltransferase
MGCRLTAMYPFGRVFHGTGLNITAMSLTGKLNIWLVACKELLPDLWRLADDFEAALKELLDASKLFAPAHRRHRIRPLHRIGGTGPTATGF